MGPAIFVAPVLCAVVVLGFLTYGAFLGLATLFGQLQRFWSHVLALDAGGTVLAMPEGSIGGHLRWDPPERRCWEIHCCPESARECCPAFDTPEIPCWLASMESSPDYRIKPECLSCKLFNIPALMTHA